MQDALIVLADKAQPVLGTVLPAGGATARTGLMAPVRIDAAAATACQGRFVGEPLPHLGKRPLGSLPIRASGLWGNPDQPLAHATPFATSRPLADARQVFQADETAGMGVQDLPGDGVVGAQPEPPRLPDRWRCVAAWQSHVPCGTRRCWTRA
jgi:hypothetical protein